MKMAQNQSKKVHTIQKNSAPVTALSGAALAGLPEVLLPWYDRERRDLPWRNIVTPYRTWVSEIMLQQTRVQAVLPYFQRFMEAAPDVAALAELPEERLLSLWQGLGNNKIYSNMSMMNKFNSNNKVNSNMSMVGHINSDNKIYSH